MVQNSVRRKFLTKVLTNQHRLTIIKIDKELTDRRLAPIVRRSNRPTVWSCEGGYFFFMLNSNIRKINVIIDVITKQKENKSCKVIYIASPPNIKIRGLHPLYVKRANRLPFYGSVPYPITII